MIEKEEFVRQVLTREHERMEKVKGASLEADKWFHHPAGFYSGRGTAKSPALIRLP
jgi:hypothetical protein